MSTEPTPPESPEIRLLSDFMRWLSGQDLQVCKQSFGELRPVGVNLSRFLHDRAAAAERDRSYTSPASQEPPRT
jgi:hypothetical protein